MVRTGGLAGLLCVLVAALLVACQPTPDVSEARVGSAKVSWEPPTEREDGSPISSIRGYTIYFGRDPEHLEYSIKVNGELTEYEIEGLEQGTWYFAVTAISENGVESERSAVGSKTI